MNINKFKIVITYFLIFFFINASTSTNIFFFISHMVLYMSWALVPSGPFLYKLIGDLFYTVYCLRSI